MNRGLRILKTLHKYSFVSYSTLPSELIIFIDDNIVVCWHPEQPFPYEFSKPLPIKQSSENPSVLKVGNKEVKEMFYQINKELVPYELAAKTYTTKHRWYPRARDKKFNKSTPMDRPYL